MKKVIFCIHGFKTGKYHDFDLFAKFVAENNLFDGQIIKIELYQMDDPKSFKFKKWRQTVLEQIKDYASEEYQIYLIGYSMGCGVAAYVASRIKVEKMIMIAPMFKLLGSKMLTHNLKLGLKSLKMRLFNRKKAKQMKRFQKLRKKVVPFALTWSIARSVGYYRRYVKKVNCPTLVMLGLEDDYSSLRSAHFAFRKIRCTKKELWFVDHLNHLFIFSASLAPEVFLKLIDYINGHQITTFH